MNNEPVPLPGFDGPAVHSQPDDALYEAYCRFTEENRAAILRVTRSAAARRYLCEEAPSLEKADFSARLRQMLPRQREQFVQRMMMGFASAITRLGDEFMNGSGPST